MHVKLTGAELPIVLLDVDENVLKMILYDSHNYCYSIILSIIGLKLKIT